MTSRYRLPANLRAYLLTAAPAAIAAPTIAELTAGTYLIGASDSEALAELSGWAAQPNIVDTPDFVSNVVGNVAGDITLPQSSMAFYSSLTDKTIYTACAVSSANRWVVLGYEGGASGAEMQVFPATIISRERRPDRNAAAMFDVGFSIAPPTIGALA